MSALEHELHAAEVPECRPPPFDALPIEKLEAIGIRDGTQPRDGVGGAAIDNRICAATPFDVVPRELSSDLGKRRIG